MRAITLYCYSGSALDSSDFLLLYPLMPLASPITIILITTSVHIFIYTCSGFCGSVGDTADNGIGNGESEVRRIQWVNNKKHR